MVDSVIAPFAGGDKMTIEAEDPGKLVPCEGDPFRPRPCPMLILRNRHATPSFLPVAAEGKSQFSGTLRDQLRVNHGFAAIRPKRRRIPHSGSEASDRLGSC